MWKTLQLCPHDAHLHSTLEAFESSLQSNRISSLHRMSLTTSKCCKYIMTLNLSVEWDVLKVAGLNTARWNVKSESKSYLDLSGSCVVITRHLNHTLIVELLNQSLGSELFHTRSKSICKMFTQTQDVHLGVRVANQSGKSVWWREKQKVSESKWTESDKQAEVGLGTSWNILMAELIPKPWLRCRFLNHY